MKRRLSIGTCVGAIGWLAARALAMPGRAVVRRIEPPMASRPFGFHR